MLRIGLVGIVVSGLVLLLCQVALPPLAEQRIAAELRSTADVQRVEVRAFPAVKLLARRADRVEVRIGAMRTGSDDLGDVIQRTGATRELDAQVAALRVGRFDLRNLRLSKQGGELTCQALLTDAALSEALPPAVGFRPVDTKTGGLVLEATAGLLGVEAKVRARLSTRSGALVVAPEGVPFGSLATLTVFDDPRVIVTGIGARRTADGYALTAKGTPAP